MRDYLGYTFSKTAFRNRSMLLRCEVITAWAVASQQCGRKGCTISEQVFCPDTWTLFFVLLLLYQKHLLLLLLAF